MDLKALMDGSDGRWTDERHSLFLNWIEASFVRRTLGAGSAAGRGAVPRRCTELYGGMRLDRHVPDSATESTEDSRRQSPAAAAIADSDRRCGSIFSSQQTRKRPHALLHASQDQVVPEIEKSKDGEGASVKKKHGGGGSIIACTDQIKRIMEE